MWLNVAPTKASFNVFVKTREFTSGRKSYRPFTRPLLSSPLAICSVPIAAVTKAEETPVKRKDTLSLGESESYGTHDFSFHLKTLLIPKTLLRIQRPQPSARAGSTASQAETQSGCARAWGKPQQRRPLFPWPE